MSEFFFFPSTGLGSAFSGCSYHLRKILWKSGADIESSWVCFGVGLRPEGKSRGRLGGCGVRPEIHFEKISGRGPRPPPRSRVRGPME